MIKVLHHEVDHLLEVETAGRVQGAAEQGVIPHIPDHRGGIAILLNLALDASHHRSMRQPGANGHVWGAAG